jgi:Ca-activated chloride channel family protein
MSFGSPDLLFSLLLVPLAVGGYFALETRRARRSAAWSRAALLSNTVQRPRRVRHVPFALFLLGLILLLTGFARPRLALNANDSYDPTVVLTFDVSGSMAADDVSPSRIGAAHALAVAFLHELPPKYRVAVVTFGGKIRVVVPPTLNRSQVIAHLPSAITTRAGTSLGDGLSASVAAISETTGNNDAAAGYPGAILLLSDGAQTLGGTTPDAAAATASIERVPVYTVTIGTMAGTVTQLLTVDGFKTSIHIKVPPSPTTMQFLASQTGGAPFYVTSATQLTPLAKKLTTVYARLNPFTQLVRRKHDLSAVAGGSALLAVLLGIGTSLRWFGRFA